MSTAEGSEASIEDILASIRKTFSDDPKTPGPPPPAGAEQRASGMPPFRSITDAAGGSSSGSALPTPPRSRAAAIDDDLDDLIDKPASRAAEPSAVKVAEATAPPVSPIEAAREKWANLLNPAGPAAGAASKPPEGYGSKTDALSPSPPSEAAPSPSVTPPPASAMSGLFAPRKGGFFPAQEPRAEPVLPMPAASANPPSAKNDEPATASPAATPPKSGFMPFWQPAASATSSAGETPAPPSAERGTAMPPPASADVPAASARVLDDLVAELNGASPPMPEAPIQMPPAARAMQPNVERPEPASRQQPAPEFTTLAAAALAAAAQRTSAAAPPVSSPAGSVVPPAAAPQTAAATEPAPSPSPASNRTFEDVVADMLRPALEKWIDENMPRIVERALQRDATLGRKPNP